MRTIDTIAIELDKPRTLLLTLPALKLIEDTLAKQRGEKRVNLFALFQGGDLGAQELLVILWAGLKHEDPNLTIEQVMRLVSRVSMRDLSAVVAEAMRQHVAGADESPAPSAGDPSGPLA